MSDEILNNIKTRRAVREMTDEGVEREQIETILEAGRWAPTGGNLRPDPLYRGRRSGNTAIDPAGGAGHVSKGARR